MSNNSLENREARRLYKQWYDTLSPEEKRRAPAPEKQDDVSGMDGNWVFDVIPDKMVPVNEKHGRIEPMIPEEERDVADDGEHIILTEEKSLYTHDEMLEVVRRVVMAMQMTESPEALFQARCILIALGIGDPPTETELAKMKGCSRQFVSKKVKRIQQMFNISPSQYMRSQHACVAYSKAYRRYRNKNRISK